MNHWVQNPQLTQRSSSELTECDLSTLSNGVYYGLHVCLIRLQRELEECKDCPEEKMYHSLHKELEELQRLCYHKQMRQHVSRRKDQHGGRKNFDLYYTRLPQVQVVCVCVVRMMFPCRSGQLQSLCLSIWWKGRGRRGWERWRWDAGECSEGGSGGYRR